MYPELLDFCATGKRMIKVQAASFFFFFVRPLTGLFQDFMCSVLLCGTETSPVLIAKGTWLCYAISNHIAPRQSQEIIQSIFG